jgi:hypothetical protein
MYRRRISVLALALAGCPGTRTAGGGASCPTDRTVTIGLQADVDRLAGCTALAGVTIRTGAPIQLAPLRALETLSGDLVLGPTVGLDEVSLAELREVGGAIQVTSNNSLRSLLLPRLERAGRVEVDDNASLDTISLPRLATVAGSLVVSGNGSLELLDLSVMSQIGKDLVITDNPKLTLVEAGRLARVLEVRVEDNRALPADQVDALRAKTPAP